jgi:DNA-binding MarR family transcriptional regulator
MPERPELGFLLNRLLHAVIDGELPILQRHGLNMWDYVVLTALGDGAAPTQAELSAATGRDKTRLIGNLDRLAEAGLIRREPDPQDRRNRIVALTGKGSTVLRKCRREIAQLEGELLSGLTASDRRVFERSLVRLEASLPESRRSLPTSRRSG